MVLVVMGSRPDSSSPYGGFADLLERLVPAWRGRQDSEHEQAVLRLLVGAIAAIYILVVCFEDNLIVANEWLTVALVVLYYICGFTLIAWLYITPAISPVRRYCGILLDNGATTGLLVLNGLLAAPVFILYLWVAFGNGFRYGRRYLAVSTGMGVAGFTLVLFTADNWPISVQMTTGLMLGLIVLPGYVATLLKRLITALENAEAANRAKSNFLATMSHEIRTPLNGIVGIIDLIKVTRLDARQKHYMELIASSTEWLMRVISDSLDFSKIEADELVLEKEPFSLEDVVLQLSGVYSEMARQKGLHFSWSLPQTLPTLLEGDRFRLIQILNNLLSNAFKFTDSGEVSLSIKASSSSENGYRLTFSVIDSGIGIANQQLDAVFQPFHQANASSTRTQGGTGLGLAIVQRLVELMGGTIEATSTLGKGSTFTFSMELPAAEQAQPAGTASLLQPVHWSRQPVILLVEDQEINREVVTTYLQNHGCQVVSAGDGNVACMLFREGDFDLIFMDCQMPVLDGYSATRDIRRLEKTNSETKPVPIIALTAHVTVEDRNRCLEAGMDDYLGKPFRSQELQAKLTKWLGHLTTATGSQPAAACPFPLEGQEPVQPLAASPRKILHDLRNQLAAIMGNAEMAVLETSSTQREELTRDLLVSAQKASALSSELAKAIPKATREAPSAPS